MSFMSFWHSPATSTENEANRGKKTPSQVTWGKHSSPLSKSHFNQIYDRHCRYNSIFIPRFFNRVVLALKTPKKDYHIAATFLQTAIQINPYHSFSVDRKTHNPSYPTSVHKFKYQMTAPNLHFTRLQSLDWFPGTGPLRSTPLKSCMIYMTIKLKD